MSGYDMYIYSVGIIGIISLSYLLYGVISRMISREVKDQLNKAKNE
jgi:hypothetical protein